MPTESPTLLTATLPSGAQNSLLMWILLVGFLRLEFAHMVCNSITNLLPILAKNLSIVDQIDWQLTGRTKFTATVLLIFRPVLHRNKILFPNVTRF